MQATSPICKNCGQPLTGNYCSNCGEKMHHENDKQLIHLLDEGFHFVTHLDGSFFTTFKTFLAKPGKYAADYCNGIRKKYFKPISFFLLLVILYLLFPFFAGLNMKFATYNSPNYKYAWYARPAALKKMETHHLTEKELADGYDKKSPAFAKFSLLLLIPMSAIVLALLFYTSRRYFFDHFILSTEIISFYIFFQFLFLPLIALLIVSISPSLVYLLSDNSWVWIISYISLAIYISIAFRNFYGQKYWLSILKAIVFFFVFFIVMRDIYNFLLYYLVMLFI